MKIFTHKIEPIFPYQFIFLGYVGIIAGIYLLVIINIWGLPLFLAGIFVSFSYAGIQIDFEKNLYHEYLGLLFLKFGKWKPLPQIQYVTVFVDRTVQEMYVASISATQTQNDININLVIEKNTFICIGKFKNKAAALKAGYLLAENLKTKLLDYTGTKAEWLNTPEQGI
jgi:hypothetical protein